MIAWLLLLLLPARALAHGAPPVATEVLAHDARGVSLVHVSRGFAYRTDEGFRFLCPESWDGNLLAPVAALADGSALVASNKLFLIEAGSVREHPVQAGQGFALASHRDAVFGVFRREGQWELRRLRADTNELVRALPEPVDDVATTDEELLSLRFEGRTIVVDRYALGGELRGSVSWQSPSFVADARLRVTGEQVFAIAFGHSAPWVTIGRVGASYEPVAEASVDIEGPVALPTGVVLGIDGALQTLTRAPFGEPVSCLGEIAGQAYACARGGDVFALDGAGVQAPMFSLDGLREPNFAAVAEAVRADCVTRWNDLRIDLTAARGNDAGIADASVLPGADAGLPARAAEGCATLPPGDGSLLLVALALLLRRRR